MSRFFKAIAKELVTEGGIEVVRGYTLERLRLVKPKDLYNAVKDGTHTLGVAENKDKRFAKRWAGIIEKLSYNGEQLRRERLTPENVLTWLRVDRPDLASLLINMGDEGAKWLKDDVKQMYAFLFPIEGQSDVQPNEQKLTLKKTASCQYPPVVVTVELTPKSDE